MKLYQVESVLKGNLQINGRGTNPYWKKARKLEDFCSPWKRMDQLITAFYSLWDSEHLFFLFKVKDDQLDIDKKRHGLDSINHSDRVELFFRTDARLDPYYCLEIDATSRIMDFKAYPNKLFDFDWNWPEDALEVKSSINKQGFIVEGKIALSSLRDLNLIHNNRMEVGVFRAKYTLIEKSEAEPTWISWINPETSTPSFHTASSFGIFELR